MAHVDRVDPSRPSPPTRWERVNSGFMSTKFLINSIFFNFAIRPDYSGPEVNVSVWWARAAAGSSPVTWRFARPSAPKTRLNRLTGASAGQTSGDVLLAAPVAA